jgi:hypothetical protein
MGQYDSGDDWVRRSRRVCDNDLMRSIVEDNRAPMTPRSQIPPAKAEAEAPKPYKHGWTDPTPLPRPEGIDLIDGLVDAQDQIDRAARVRELGEAAALKRAEAEFLKSKERKEK